MALRRTQCQYPLKCEIQSGHLQILITITENQSADLTALDKLYLLKLDGAQIRCCPTLNEKILIVGSCKVLTGSEDISASNLGINRAPTKECGVISDEAQLIGRTKEKYNGMWEKGDGFLK